jgi:hypothetical protein
MNDMLDIGLWSFVRVALASILWVGLNLALAAGLIYLRLRRAHSSGSGGIGAVAGTGELALILLYLFGPPILLTLVWLFVRRS